MLAIQADNATKKSAVTVVLAESTLCHNDTHRCMESSKIVSNGVTHASAIQIALGVSKIPFTIIGAGFLYNVSIDRARFRSTVWFVIKKYSSILRRFKGICRLLKKKRRSLRKGMRRYKGMKHKEVIEEGVTAL